MALKQQQTFRVLEYLFIIVALLLISDALTPLLYLDGGNGAEVSESNPSRLFMAMGVYSIAALLLLPRLRPAWDLLVRRPEIGLIVIWSLFSVLWSGAVAPVFRRAVADALTVVFCFYVATRYTPEEVLNRLLVVFFIGGCASIILCLAVPSLAVHGKTSVEDQTNVGAWFGAYGHKAILGRACTLAIFTSLAVRPEIKILKNIRIANIFIFGLLAIMSQSRASWLMIIWGLGAMGMMQLLRTRMIESRLKVGIIVIGGAAALAIAASTFVVLLTAFGRGLDFSGRGEMWSGAIQLAQRENTWIGVGYRNFWLGDSAKDMLPFLEGWTRVPGHGHNGYLDTWLELGWIGAAFLAFFILRGFPSIIRAMVRAPHRPALMVFAIFFLVFIINNMSASVAMRHTDILWSMSIIGTLFAARFALDEKRLAEALRRSQLRRRRRRRSSSGGSGSSASAGGSSGPAEGRKASPSNGPVTA
jgi:O-antigen ligase